MDGPLLITALVEHIEDVRDRLGPALAGRLDALLAEVGATDDPDELEELAIDLADLVEPSLPPDHPVRRAVTARPRLATPGDLSPVPELWAEALDALRIGLGPSDAPDPGSPGPPGDRPSGEPDPESPGPPDGPPGEPAPRDPGSPETFATPAELLRSVRERLLTAPSHRPGDVLDGHDPGLVRLRAPDGTDRVPAFQFDSSGRARPLVLLVNRLLDVEDDPWGVADWWLGGNAWLGGAPAALLDGGRDDDLVAAAQAELERI